MNTQNFTEKGIKLIDDLKSEKYNELSKYYDPFVGNFQFDFDTMMYCIDEIDMWIKEHEEFFIYHQHIEDYNGYDWFVTDWK